MLVPLSIEFFDNPRVGSPRAFVREVHGVGENGLIEKDCQCHRDYSKANSVGSRGVIGWYFLKEWGTYHISSPTSWRNVDEYYCQVRNGEIVRLNGMRHLSNLLQTKKSPAQRMLENEEALRD